MLRLLLLHELLDLLPLQLRLRLLELLLSILDGRLELISMAVKLCL